MSNVRDYLRKRAERKENKKTEKNMGNLIIKHRMAIITRTILVLLLCAGLGATIYVQLKNQVFTSYVTLSTIEKQQYDNAACMNYENGFLTYSKDGISYTDTKGNALWNQTFEMQNPMVRIAKSRVAVADYNGHIIHNIAQSGDAVEIDTNLPIREFALAENGMVAAILEDTNITWIYLYNSNGEKVAYVKTTMQKSGYPVAVALSPDGKLMAVSYVTVESGAAKSSVAFYNFSSVGQNFVDNFASGADYVDAVIPYITFLSKDTAFAVADNRLVLYGGDQRPKSTADVLLDEEIQSVFYNETNIGLVFLDTTGTGKYRLDVYNTSGAVVTSLYFDMDYKDIILYKDTVIIYNETQCTIFNMRGLERFRGEFEKPVLLFSPLSTKKYLAVTKDSIDIIEMK
nr:DUF5711 family protein [uncultured Eisenbergiella sp.]